MGVRCAVAKDDAVGCSRPFVAAEGVVEEGELTLDECLVEAVFAVGGARRVGGFVLPAVELQKCGVPEAEDGVGFFVPGPEEMGDEIGFASSCFVVSSEVDEGMFVNIVFLQDGEDVGDAGFGDVVEIGADVAA